MTEPVGQSPEDDVIREGSLTPGGNRIGPKAWQLIVSLSEYDDWFGAVVEVVDEAATVRPPGDEAGLRAALRLVDESIFDLPIGNDVTYSRGYSAGTSAAKTSARDALLEALANLDTDS